MNFYENSITLDVSGRRHGTLIHAKQGDKDSRQVTVTLVENGQPYEVAQGVTPEFRCKKPSGYICDNPAVLNDDGTITITLTEQAIAEVGTVLADVALRDGEGKVLSSSTFDIRVAESGSNGQHIDSTNEMLVLNDLINRGNVTISESERIVSEYEETLAEIDEKAETAVNAAQVSVQNAQTSTEAANVSQLNAETSATNAAAAEQAKEAAVQAAETFETDPTLTQEGKAADSKATGDAIGHESTDSGTIVEIESEEPPVITEIKVFGMSEQKTLTGKNLLDPTKARDNLYINISGITNNTVTQYWSTAYIDVKPETHYKCNYKHIVAVLYDEAFKGIAFSHDTNDAISTVGYPTVKYLRVCLEKSFVTFDKKDTVMLEEGTVSTDFEPYCGGIPSPNPEYPQKITNIGDGGSLDLMVTGKNLFPAKYLMNHTSAYKVNDDGSVTWHTNVDSRPFTQIPYIYLSPGDYVAKASTTGGGNFQVVLRSIYNPDVYIADYTSTDGIIAFTVESYVMFSAKFYGDVSLPVTANIQLERGSTPTEYEPFGGSATLTTALPLCAIPVSSGGNYTDENGQQYIADVLTVNGDGSGLVEKRTNKLVFNGSENWYAVDDGNQTNYMFNLSVPGQEQFDSALITPFATISQAWNDSLIHFINEYTQLRIGGLQVISVYPDLDSFKSYLQSNPMTLVYEIAPTTISLTPSEVQTVLRMQGFAPKTTITAEFAPVAVYYATGAVGKAYAAGKNTAATMLGYIADLQAQLTETQAQMI